MRLGSASLLRRKNRRGALRNRNAMQAHWRRYDGQAIRTRLHRDQLQNATHARQGLPHTTRPESMHTKQVRMTTRTQCIAAVRLGDRATVSRRAWCAAGQRSCNSTGRTSERAASTKSWSVVATSTYEYLSINFCTVSNKEALRRELYLAHAQFMRASAVHAAFTGNHAG